MGVKVLVRCKAIQPCKTLCSPHPNRRRHLLVMVVMAVVGGVMMSSRTNIYAQLAWTQRWILRNRDMHLPWATAGSQRQPLSHYYVKYPGNYPFVLDEPHLCQRLKPFLVIVVPVAPHERAAREAIRQTWGGGNVWVGRVVLTLFLLGLPGGEGGGGGGGGGGGTQQLQSALRQEHSQHHNLLQASFVDSYGNLTLKTLLMMEWLSSRCPQATFATKVDSDVFLNVRNLVTLLADPNIPTRQYITGNMYRQGPVQRNPNSKWFLPEEVYPESVFPTYTLGYCYAFSIDLSAKVVKAARLFPPIYIEDLALGLYLNHLGIAPSDPPSPDLFRGHRPLLYNRCDYFTSISTILLHSAELISVWEDLRQHSSSC
ncbi:beta-1,3-galactosyltransferase 1-like [Sardina pilchardus]|uniref:beta-1,3-galactosyltransferase 1-like n=1 Tax=Sardina pilchardus TaxID=27697 RepID=UPI002E110A98